MTRFDEKKITTVDSDQVITKYKIEYMKEFQNNILLSCQVDNMQKVIMAAFKKDPAAFPKDFTLEKEDEKNGSNNN